ncbi:MAG: JAB domain-containing protein [Ignavibacteria bacterium]|jgi:DNA repair protein RadC
MNIRLSEKEKIKILNSDDLFDIMQRILKRENKIDRDREHFWVIGLASNNRLLFIELISKGTINKALVEPMEVFSFALQKRAVNIMLVHNHPSGELRPSVEDNDITDRLIQVGIIVNTHVLDHLIISEKSYLSYLSIGLLDELKKSTKYVPPYKQLEMLKKAEREKGKEQGKKEGEKIGVKKGIKEGEERGAKLKAIEMARICLEKKMEIKVIAELTGLTEPEIEKIKKELEK